MSIGGLVGKDPRSALASVALLAAMAMLVGILQSAAPHSSASATAGSTSTSDAYGKLALGFAPNSGQVSKRVEFSTSTAAGSIALTRDGAMITPSAKGAEPVRMRLAGADARSAVGGDRLPGVVNDFRGSNPQLWQTNVPTFARVSYEQVYPGIGLDYFGNDGTLEYDFRVAAGADPSQIAVDFGDAPVRLAGNGDLLIGGGKAVIRQQAPVAYQPGADGKTPVDSRFETSHGTVGFKLGAYDHSRPLVVDPLVLAYSTYLGGSDYEELHGMTVDSSGNSYVVGATGSSDFPTENPYRATLHGTAGNNFDAFVSKLNPSGTGLVYSTYLGGDGLDIAYDVAVDSTGSAYVTGQTESTNYPITAGVVQSQLNGEPSNTRDDVFVTKLGANGSALGYSTYIGGNNSDYGYSIAVGNDGSAYVTGKTNSFTDVNPTQTPYPTSPGAFQGVSGNGFADDAFVTKLNPTGTSFSYSTYLDDQNSPPINVSSQGHGIAVNSSGQAYVTGNISGDSFPVTASKYEGSTHNQGGQLTSDGFLAKFNAAGSAMVYSTYFGGAGDDFPTDVAIDSDGRAFIAGSTSSGDYDLKNQYQGHVGFTYPYAFLTEIDPSQSGSGSLVYSSLLGGTGSSGAASVAVDSSGDAYVGGSNGSGSSFPAVNPISSTNTGAAFLTKFDTSQSGANSIVYSSTIPTNPSGVGGAAVSAVGVVGTDAYIAGTTSNNYYPTTSGAYLEASNSTAAYQKGDGFISKLTYSSGPDTTPPETTITSGPANGSTISTTTASFGFSSNEAGSSFQCSIDSTTAYSACTTPYTTPTLGNGSHTFRVRATDGSNNTDATPDSRVFTVNTGPPPDTTPPQTTIKSPPPKTIMSSKLPVDVKFTFKSSESGATYKCKIDSKAYKSCTSPAKYALGKGKHTFSVKSTDSSGNEDATAATAKVEVKKKKHHPHHHHRA